METRRRSSGRQALRLIYATAVVFCLCMWLAISSGDDAAIRGFAEQTPRWQHDPEFRSIAMDYCIRGSRSMQARLMGVSARSVVMTVRSIPFLPARFAVNPTSQAHYESFGAGPLSGYLFLCGEQTVPSFADVLDGALKDRSGPGSPERIFLESFHMDFPVCTDTGAQQSAAALFRDIGDLKPLTIRQDITPLLLPHVRAIAQALHMPDDPRAMSFEQQLAVLERLDLEVRQTDPELWRTKQLSDFCGGVWAQVFAPSYRLITTPILAAHQWALPVLIVLLLWPSVRSRIHRKRPQTKPKKELVASGNEVD